MLNNTLKKKDLFKTLLFYIVLSNYWLAGKASIWAFNFEAFASSLTPK